MIRRLTAAGLVVVAVLATAALASANGARPETFTAVTHGTMVFPDHVSPCTGEAALVTVTYNGVFHVTAFPDGHYQMHSMVAGTLVADPNDPALPDEFGPFADTQVENSTSNTFTTTVVNNVHMVRGTPWAFHFDWHMTIVGTEVVVDRFDLSCR